MEVPKKDDVFMTLVYVIASLSKDKNTKLGAVIIGPDNEIRSVGYNGFVRGLEDNVPERQERPEKYFWFEHAERNAIYNATLQGVSLKGCRMYTNGIPCDDCARGVIQSGIREVIVDKLWNDLNDGGKWREHAERSIVMFEETGVKLRYHNTKLITPVRFRRGQIIPE
jgi:dCMP deaminase